MIRFFDIFFSFLGILILSPFYIILSVIGYFDTGSPFFLQKRMGKNKSFFTLFKFRSMHLSTESLPTHLLQTSSVTRWGAFIRRSKLDELPQLVNIFLGQMSFVGPRPNLPNQDDLIHQRSVRGVYQVRPGITGLAQIQKVDMSTPALLAEIDAQMIAQMGVLLYFKCILLTLTGNGFGDRLKNEQARTPN